MDWNPPESSEAVGGREEHDDHDFFGGHGSCHMGFQSMEVAQ